MNYISTITNGITSLVGAKLGSTAAGKTLISWLSSKSIGIVLLLLTLPAIPLILLVAALGALLRRGDKPAPRQTTVRYSERSTTTSIVILILLVINTVTVLSLAVIAITPDKAALIRGVRRYYTIFSVAIVGFISRHPRPIASILVGLILASLTIWVLRHRSRLKQQREKARLEQEETDRLNRLRAAIGTNRPWSFSNLLLKSMIEEPPTA